MQHSRQAHFRPTRWTARRVRLTIYTPLRLVGHLGLLLVLHLRLLVRQEGKVLPILFRLVRLMREGNSTAHWSKHDTGAGTENKRSERDHTGELEDLV